MRFVLVLIALAGCGDKSSPPPPTTPVPVQPPVSAEPGAAQTARGIIVMIGDGMGPEYLDAASLYAHGARGKLFMQSLPVHGTVATDSDTGITDSAAAATSMSSGAVGINHRVGEDADGNAVTHLFEIARARGWGTGVVTTASLPHATPAGFTVKSLSRYDYEDIAAAQVELGLADVMLGGGGKYFGLASVTALTRRGYTLVRTADDLAAVVPVGNEPKLFGVFSERHLPWVLERKRSTTAPTLEEMSLRALDVLARYDMGFVLVIEGARIDMAGHDHELDHAVAETIAFDATVEAVAGWAAAREHIALIVTADHETGGLRVKSDTPAGKRPDAVWTADWHTDVDIHLFARGPGTRMFDGVRSDHRWIHAVVVALIQGTPVVAPP